MDKAKDLFISSVIVAAGKSSRMKLDVNKQYIEIGGVPVITRTLKAFQQCGLINEIILVVNKDDIEYCKDNIVDRNELDKVTAVVGGGSERQGSVYKGLLKVNKESDIVLIHDGARPFVKHKEIEESIKAAQQFGASGVAVRVKDTIKKADANNLVAETVERSCLWAIQTPQVFKYDLIMKAHQKAELDGYTGTDDTMLVERMGRSVKLVEGSYDNIKITTQEDLIIAEIIAKRHESCVS